MATIDSPLSSSVSNSTTQLPPKAASRANRLLHRISFRMLQGASKVFPPLKHLVNRWREKHQAPIIDVWGKSVHDTLVDQGQLSGITPLSARTLKIAESLATKNSVKASEQAYYSGLAHKLHQSEPIQTYLEQLFVEIPSSQQSAVRAKLLDLIHHQVFKAYQDNGYQPLSQLQIEHTEAFIIGCLLTPDKILEKSFSQFSKLIHHPTTSLQLVPYFRECIDIIELKANLATSELGDINQNQALLVNHFKALLADYSLDNQQRLFKSAQSNHVIRALVTALTSTTAAMNLMDFAEAQGMEDSQKPLLDLIVGPASKLEAFMMALDETLHDTLANATQWQTELLKSSHAGNLEALPQPIWDSLVQEAQLRFGLDIDNCRTINHSNIQPVRIAVEALPQQEPSFKPYPEDPLINDQFVQDVTRSTWVINNTLLSGSRENRLNRFKSCFTDESLQTMITSHIHQGWLADPLEAIYDHSGRYTLKNGATTYTLTIDSKNHCLNVKALFQAQLSHANTLNEQGIIEMSELDPALSHLWYEVEGFIPLENNSPSGPLKMLSISGEIKTFQPDSQ